jgi:phosphatidylserine decarboxylase
MKSSSGAFAAAGRLIGRALGLIQYGSRCDLYLPLAAPVAVQPGDRVVGGETFIARRAGAPPGPNPAGVTPLTSASS